jgi:carbohydrate-binding DOMON domain-containing protein
LQAIDVYIDTDGLADSGRRDLFLARKARTRPENAWEFFVRASMDTLAVYDASLAPLGGVKVTSYADPASHSIFVKLPRAALQPAVETGGGYWYVIVAMLSHDGYAEGGVRPVKAVRQQWVVGGCDAENLCPAIMDLVVEGGVSQEAVLGAYRSTGTLSEIPGVKVTLP